MCEHELTRSVVGAAERCRCRVNSFSYAASQSMLDNMILPTVGMDSPVYSIPASNGVCSEGRDEICSTVMAIVSSMSDLRLIVHIVDSHGPHPHVLMDVTESSSSPATCMVMSVGNPRAGGSPEGVSLYAKSNTDGKQMSESSAIQAISSISKVCNTLFWYWTLDATGYTAVFNQQQGTRWVITLFPDAQPNAPLCGVTPGESSNGSLVRVLPFMYTSHESPTVAVMGEGFSGGICGDDLKVELMALSQLAISRVYRSRASTGRCFCCQYIVNAHGRLHTDAKAKETDRKTLRLEKKFQQRMGR